MSVDENEFSGPVSRARFYLARAIGDEKRLGLASAQIRSLKAELHGKTIAIVGNSRALALGSCGERIDAADLVIRINRAPMPATRSHGFKTNWLALATSLARAEAGRINPDRILWMSHKRKRLPYWVASRPGFFLYSNVDFHSLFDRLGAQPTTGAMIIDLVVSSTARTIDLFGFDFFSSLSLTGGRTAGQVPHDFAAEKAWVETQLNRDSRLKIWN